MDKPNTTLELRAQPIIYMEMLENETQEEAVERLTNKLYTAGLDICNASLTVENTEIQTQ